MAIALLMLAPVLSGCAEQRHGPKTDIDPFLLAHRLRENKVPVAGSLSASGVRFDHAGYEALLHWYDTIPPEPAWAADYEALDVGLPCCGAVHPFAQEDSNCGCGHHRALYGSAKRALTLGWGRTQVQQELDRWRAYFFPQETITAELERLGLDPAEIREALEELQQEGGC